MKMWRRLAAKEGPRKDGKRVGRAIKHHYQMQEMWANKMVKTYPLLKALLIRAGVIVPPVDPAKLPGEGVTPLEGQPA